MKTYYQIKNLNNIDYFAIAERYNLKVMSYKETDKYNNEITTIFIDVDSEFIEKLKLFLFHSEIQRIISRQSI